MRTLSTVGDDPNDSGSWVQVSRLGMPLTNEAVIPIGYKDYWNSLTPYQELADTQLDEFFYNPIGIVHGQFAVWRNAGPGNGQAAHPTQFARCF